MSDTHRDDASRKPLPARLPAPSSEASGGRKPARASRSKGERHTRRRGRGRRSGSARRPPPDPGRASNADPPASVEKVSVTLGGEPWTARVRGRSGGDGAPPLLLLGFWAGDETSTDDPPELEALAAARSLASLGELGLARAFEVARPPKDPDDRPPFFDGAGEGRRR